MAGQYHAEVPALSRTRRRTGGLAQQFVEIGDGAAQAVVQRHFGFPTKFLLGEADVGATLHRVIHGQRPVDDFGCELTQADNAVSQFAHRDFVRVADVDRSGDIRAGTHQPDQAVDQVIDVAKARVCPPSP